MSTLKKLIVGILVLLSGVLIYYFFVPSTADKLWKDGPWCVNSIYYKGRLIQPKTLHAIYMVRTDGKIPCLENISFDNDGNVQLPGINSRAIAGEWLVDSTKKLQLNVDTLKDIFEGSYDISINGVNLVLKSRTTIINANRKN
jgi:hypothetical protein